MELLEGWDALQRLTTPIARDTSAYSINLYAGPEQIARWCAAGGVRAHLGDGAVLVTREDGGFSRVYHVARDDAALARVLQLLPAGRYVSDLVGRGELLDRMADVYAAAGFAAHAFLRRMSRTAVTPPHAPGEGVLAVEPADAGAVARFLGRLLDPLTEQLPQARELEAAARQGRLLVVPDGAALAGMLMYDVQGRLAHLRFWHVAPEAQGAGVGRRLMTSFLLRCGAAARIILWVVGDNHRSIAIYRHYGFEADGLLDRVMVLNKD